MSDRHDPDRELAEEEELLRLLGKRHPTAVVPPFSAVARRAERQSTTPLFALAAAAVLVAVVVAGIGAWRAATAPAAPTPSGADGCPTAPPGALVGPQAEGRWLVMSLDAVEPTDAQTNQIWWKVRFSVPRGAPGPATVMARAETRVAGASLQILSYGIDGAGPRTVADGESLTVAPCTSLVVVVRTAGPLIEGAWRYTVSIEKIVLPEGGTVTETLGLPLSCANQTRRCTPVDVTVVATPAATPAPGVLKPDFGVIYDGIRQGYDKGSAPLLRREGETDTAVGELAPSFFNRFIGAVSTDGRRAAYFAQREGQPWALYLLDGAKPSDQRVLTGIPGEIPYGDPVWSSDGNGLAYTVADEGANQGVKPTYSAIRTIDLSSGAVSEIARARDGSGYAVIGWERATSTLAAVVSPYAARATTYVVFSPAGPRMWTLDGFYSTYAVASNGRDVAGVRCDLPTKECSLWTWNLDDFGSKVDRRLGSNFSVIGWRPGTTELGLLVGAGNAVPDRIELWSPDGSRRSIAQVSGAGIGARFFRADGSAVIVQTSQTDASIVDLATGGVSPFPLHAPEAQFDANRIRASIRLGS